jgi:hypothetical protein
MPRSLSLGILLTLLAAGSAAAQSPDASSPAPAARSKESTAAADAAKPKKVWTNENLSDASGAISVVGEPKSKPKTASTKPADAQYIATTRKHLEKLQSQMVDADKQITDLTNFSKGEPSTNASGIKLNKSYNREPIEVQIRVLQEKKKDLQAQIDTLLDEARKKGVEPGQLR